MIEATVCLPWRPTEDRIAAHDYCLKFWHDNGFQTIEADSDPEQPFLCNQARNNAVRQADTPVVIIADADTLPHHIKQIQAAVRAANLGLNVVWPFTLYRTVPPTSIGDDDLYNAPVIDEAVNATGGIIICRRETYWEIGGYDELFVPGAWGYDDAAFMCAAETLAQVVRVAGIVYSFDHAVQRDPTDKNPNKARFLLYKFARGNPEIMRALIGLR